MCPLLLPGTLPRVLVCEGPGSTAPPAAAPLSEAVAATVRRTCSATSKEGARTKVFAQWAQEASACGASSFDVTPPQSSRSGKS